MTDTKPLDERNKKGRQRALIKAQLVGDVLRALREATWESFHDDWRAMARAAVHIDEALHALARIRGTGGDHWPFPSANPSLLLRLMPQLEAEVERFDHEAICIACERSASHPAMSSAVRAIGDRFAHALLSRIHESLREDLIAIHAERPDDFGDGVRFVIGRMDELLGFKDAAK